jgi:hypothetical protein
MTSAMSERLATECTVRSPQSARTETLKYSIQIIHNKNERKKHVLKIKYLRRKET